MRWIRMSALLLGVVGSMAAAAAEFRAARGTAELWLHEEAAAQLGLALAPPGAQDAGGELYERHTLALAGELAFELAWGHVATARRGALALELPLVLRYGGGKSRHLELKLVPWHEGTQRLALADAERRVWFTLNDVHQQLDLRGRELSLGYQDLRVGPALAKLLRQRAARGMFLGGMHFALAGESDRAKGFNDCPVAPNVARWPGTPGTTADVALAQINALDSVCEGGACAGPSSPTATRVKLIPSVKLQNVGTADIPWYPLFSSATRPPGAIPYPYDVPDQHPFLVWNIYRIDAAGRLEPAARSGVKHAFFSTNTDCSCEGDTVLWAQGCSDTYDAASNEVAGVLGPRDEIIPFTGRFARCGSVFDADCDDVQGAGPGSSDAPFAAAPFQFRSIVTEQALAAGGQWLVEGWYLIRDDANVYNTMGTRAFTPTWVPPNGPTPGFWRGVVAGGSPMVLGPMIDRYVAAGTSTASDTSREIVTADGRLKIVSRVAAVAAARYRYDYYLMNVDFSRPVSTGSGTMLALQRNHGLVSLEVPVTAEAAIADLEFVDGDPAADWTATASATAVTFAAPAGQSLDWGSVYRYSFTSAQAPALAAVTVRPFEGSPASFSAEALAPTETPLFANGFE